MNNKGLHLSMSILERMYQTMNCSTQSKKSLKNLLNTVQSISLVRQGGHLSVLVACSNLLYTQGFKRLRDTGVPCLTPGGQK